MRSKTADAAAKRLRLPFAVATVLLVALLAVFAYALADSQHKQRSDINKRFEDRARVAATINESLFALVGSTVKPTDSGRFGGKTVDQTALEQRTAVQQQDYAVILSSTGEVLAKVGDVPADIASHPNVRQALRSNSAVYSSLMQAPGGSTSIESAIAFPTKYGVRLDVSAGNADALGQFLNSFLTKLPTVANAKSYVIDNAGKVIATPGSKTRAGTQLGDKDLAKTVRGKTVGSYDGDRYFASDAIAGTPWRIVLSAATKDLYASVETTVSWLIFAAFVIVSLGGLLLLWRVLISNAELERADLSRRHALEINDNVVQRLVLAKYALDRGATETSQQKLAETLRETQQLVTSLLEEREIAPGALRRDAPADAEGPPARPPVPSEDGR
jgi:C4-dicarboxylate-specific signal transduction histidine kinase